MRVADKRIIAAFRPAKSFVASKERTGVKGATAHAIAAIGGTDYSRYAALCCDTRLETPQ